MAASYLYNSLEVVSWVQLQHHLSLLAGDEVHLLEGGWDWQDWGDDWQAGQGEEGDWSRLLRGVGRGREEAGMEGGPGARGAYTKQLYWDHYIRGAGHTDWIHR